ncbi:MAG TPA: hypothetical protein VI603_18420 [Saprospiraceae bacterium]|nr:hypothetical protein [Saprospiraceae bacterium]
MKTYQLFFLSAAILLRFTCACVAQPFTDIASLNYQYHLPTKYQEPQTAQNRNLYFKSAELLLPLSLGNGSYILAGGQYSRIDFGFDVGLRLSQGFNVAEGRVGCLYQWKNQKDKTLFLLIPKWAGEEKAFASEYFQLGGVFLHTHQLSPDFSYKFGLYYNREFFGNFFMPLVGLEWQINENLWLYGTLPGNLQLHKVLKPSLAVSLSYVSPSGSLLLENGSDYIRIGKSFPPNAVVSADLHWTIFSPVVLKASVGHSLWRSYGQYNAANEQYESGEYADYKDGFVLKASIVFRVLEKS